MTKKLILLAMLLCVCFFSCKKEAEKKSADLVGCVNNIEVQSAIL